MRMVFALVLVLVASPVWGFHYQYNTTTLDVTGGNMDENKLRNTPGYAYFERAGEPTFPAPTGCATGRLEWSRVDQHPNPTSIVLKSGIKVFRCRTVESADHVDAVVNELSKELCDRFPQPDPLVAQLKLDVDRICEGESSSDCTAAEAAYEAVRTARAQSAATKQAEARRLTEAIQLLHTEAAVFKSDQGW